MKDTTSTPGERPVSADVEEKIRREARRKGVLVWLDRHSHYTDFVDRVVEKSEAGEFPHPVIGFRGSFLETMFKLEGELDGKEPRPLVLHVPGYNQETIKETPLLGLFRAGKRWRIALSSLVEGAAAGEVPRDVLGEFLDSQGDDLTLEAADKWLHDLLATSKDQPNPLEHIEVETQIARLLEGEPPASSVSREAAREHLRVALGPEEEWLDDFASGVPSGSSLESLGRAAATWALAAEFVDDLRREPFASVLDPLRDLPKTLVQACRSVAEHLRRHCENEYVRLARDFEPRLEEERTRGDAADLGDIDTFPFEEQVIFESSLEALENGEWSRAIRQAENRDVSSCFWVRRERDRQDRWTLVRRAARLGELLEVHRGLLSDVTSLEEAIERYAEAGWQVDRAHRKLEQDRNKYLRPRLPDFVDLRDALDSLRKKYRAWADETARDFNDLCDEHGFLATESMRQRTLFNDVVEPLVDDHKKVALLTIDALRFEMAQDLMEALADESGTEIALDSRFAELPTRTAVGMNVIPPVADGGRLEPVVGDNGRISAMQANQFQVMGDDSRRKMMRHAVGGRACPGLTISEIRKGEESLTRKIQNASLVVVHHGDIDAAGEKGHGLSMFEETLTDIREAIRLLRKAGIDDIVVTADHGFLLQDETTVRRIDEGKKTSPQARYSVYRAPEEDADRISASPQELAYDVDDDLNFVFPRDTSLFDTGGRAQTYVHGGNSPQERIVPVLTMSADKPGGSTRQYEIVADKQPPIDELQRLEVRVTADQTALDFGGPEEIELAIRTPQDPAVNIDLQSLPGAGELRGDTFMAPLDEKIEVVFRASGPKERQVPVEVRAPTMTDAVETATPEGRFAVQKRAARVEEEGEQTTESESSSSGIENLPDDGTRDVFEHLATYGEISEEDATELLGNSVKFRNFSRNLEEYVEQVSFEVKVSTVDFEKHYERVGDV